MRVKGDRRVSCALVSLLVMGFVQSFADERGAVPNELDGVAGAETLTAPQREAVGANGFVILPQEYKQIFEVYNELKPPFFITADSVIQAFSVILEDCIRKQESTFYDDLYECLVRLEEGVQAIRQQLDSGPATGGQDAKRCEAAYVFLAGFCGTAGRLLDPAFPVDARVAGIVSREVALIEGAAGEAESPLTRGLRDYSSFAAKRREGVRKRGQRYYRCVEFLKTTGFRVESEREALAMTLLALYGDVHMIVPRLSEFWTRVFGGSDDLGIQDAAVWRSLTAAVPEMYWRGPGVLSGPYPARADDLRRFSAAVQRSLRAARAPRINDGDLSVGEFRDWERMTKSVRLLGAVYLPDAELLFRGAEPHLEGRELPSALDVGVLLGSERARRLIGGTEPSSAVRHVEEWVGRVDVTGESLYCRFLRILRGYLEEGRRNAGLQRAFGTPGWEDKTLNTVLCGWALVRHAASIAGKDVKEWRCCSEKELVGYVEPVPEFYLAMVELLCAFEPVLCSRDRPSLRLRAAEILDMWEVIEEAGVDDLAQFLRVRPEHYEVARDVLGFDAHSAYGSKADIRRYADAARRYLEGRPRTAEENSKAEVDESAIINADGKRAVWVRNGRRGFLQGVSDEEALKRTVDGNAWGFEEYRLLIRICARLAAISEKEIQKIPLDREEEIFLAYYGEHLGNACFYSGNSWIHPFDDMPVTVEVCWNPLRGKRLYCGIGRAKCMKVLIRSPWTGKEVLCSGGVTLFHEHVTGGPMDDIGWRGALGQPDGPKPADWMGGHVRE